MDWREQVNSYELKPARKLPTHPPFNVISSQGSRTRFPPDYYDIGPMKIKLICNFGGRFLPRPSDGELRYVGGDRHLIKISQYISWQELVCKTTKFIRRAHMIKYHLPGEQVSMLISVTSDDDLRHMIDECLALGKSQERLTMYLLSGNDDERPTHFIVGSPSDAEKEAQFIALVNGFIRPGDELRTQSIGSSSMNRVDQLISGINGEELSAGRTNETSQYIKDNPLESITVRTKTSTGQLDKTPPSSQRRMINQDYKAQSNAANMISAVRNTINACHGSSEPTEIMYIAKKEQGADHAVSRHQPGLQRTTTNTSGKSHKASGAQEKGSSRKQLLVPLDNISVKVLSPNSKYNSPMPHRETSPSSPASLSRISQRIVNQESSDENTMNSITYSIQEEATFRLEEEPLRKSGNFRLNNKMETSEPSHESDTPMRCNVDIFEEKPSICKKAVATNSIQKQPHVVPATCSNTSKKGNPSVPISNSGEAAISYSFTSSDKTTDLQPNTLLRALSERIQERPSSPRQDEHSSKITRFRSVGTDNINHQISCPSEEAKDSAALLISELEVHETKSREILPANAVLGRNLTSNVQIISNEDLEDLREMGSGAFGTVFHGKWKGTDVAIKRIKNSCFTYPSSQADKLITEFWREAAIISKLHHPNILALYGIVKNGPGGTLATVTEFMVNGSLKKVLLRRDKCLDWRKRIMVALDAAIGMEYLHSKDIVHFDLKCDNLLVNIKDPSRPICKVADFGLSKMKQATMVSGGMRGTLPWMAPELLTMSGTKVSEKVDVYSFGVVMWEILTGEDPYDGMHYGGVIGGILSNTLRPPVPTSCNPEWRKLMEQCWSTEPERRPSFTEVATCLRGMLEASKSESLS